MPTADTIIAERRMTVAKHNSLVRDMRYDLNLREQKVLLYLISKIKPEDDKFSRYQASVTTLCDVCGIAQSRGNIIELRKIMLELRNKGFWLPTPSGGSVTASWLAKCEFDKANITATVTFDEDLLPYLLQLRENYTSYELEFVLAMQSRHGIRLFELVKSYAYQGFFDIPLSDLRDILRITGYTEYNNFKVRVLDVAVDEINRYTDINVAYEAVRNGRKVALIRFIIDPKYPGEDTAAYANRQEVLNND